MKRTSNPGHPNSKQPEIPKAQYVCNSSDEDECREAFHLNPKQKQTPQLKLKVPQFKCVLILVQQRTPLTMQHMRRSVPQKQCLKTNQRETSPSWRRQPCPDSPCQIVFRNDQYSVRADGPDQVPGTQSTQFWLPPEL